MKRYLGKYETSCYVDALNSMLATLLHDPGALVAHGPKLRATTDDLYTIIQHLRTVPVIPPEDAVQLSRVIRQGAKLLLHPLIKEPSARVYSDRATEIADRIAELSPRHAPCPRT